MNRFITASALAVVLSVPAQVAGGAAHAATSICDAIAGNLVQNCGFEGGTYNTGPNFAPAVTPDDWTVNSVFSNDGFANGVRQMPNSGVNNLQIGPASGNVDPGNPAIWQTLTDTAGVTYTATFYFYTTSGANETIPNALFQAVVDGTTYFSLPPDGIGPGEYRSYTEETFTFTGTGSDVLEFIAGTGNNSAPNWELDDVSVVGGSPGVVPERSTWAMMLLGFAGLAFAGRRGSRKAGAAAPA